MSRFSMTEDLRDCHADELAADEELVKGVRSLAAAAFSGAARARSAERDAISHLRRTQS